MTLGTIGSRDVTRTGTGERIFGQSRLVDQRSVWFFSFLAGNRLSEEVRDT